ncbi:MAG: DegV family protein [Bacillota bacterium]
MKVITGKDIYNAFNNGAVEINKNEENLNSMNVFPVPDGDTGSNLVFTINSILDYVEDKDSLESVVKDMSKGAIAGARGNSGFIFAQFINGFYKQVKSKKHITEKEFIIYLDNTVPYVFESIANPVKGTILTMIQKWTDYMIKTYEKEKDFKNILRSSLNYCKEILNQTTNELEVLRKNGVVDAGAKGFYHFIEGISKYFIQGIVFKRKVLLRKTTIESSHEIKNIDDNSYRYCTEFFIQKEKIDKTFLKNYISNLGNSFIITVNDHSAKIHIHTNDPDTIAKKLYSKGYKIIENKVDDMFLQVKSNNDKSKKIALVTDSVADIDKEIIKKYDIHVIPLLLNINGNEFLDRLTINSDMFFEFTKSKSVKAKSSTPNLKYVKKLFKELSNKYEEVVYISLASKLSGTYRNILNQTKEFKNITVIDSKKNSGAQGIVVLKAAKYIKKGFSLEKIKQKISKVIDNTFIYVAVDNFNSMVKGGRVPNTVGKIGNFLNLKPIISLNKEGKGIAFGGSFSKNGAIDKIYRKLEKSNEDYKIENIIISYSYDKSEALSLKKRIEKNLNLKVNSIVKISNVVAISAGKKAISISFNRR